MHVPVVSVAAVRVRSRPVAMIVVVRVHVGVGLATAEAAAAPTYDIGRVSGVARKNRGRPGAIAPMSLDPPPSVPAETTTP